MAVFTINEDFPKSEIEFDARFSNPQACYDYLFKQKWPHGFRCRKCDQQQVLDQCTSSLYLHPVSAQQFIDRGYDYGQFQKASHLLVQSHVGVFTNTKIRYQCGEPKGTVRPWQLRHSLELATKN